MRAGSIHVPLLGCLIILSPLLACSAGSGGDSSGALVLVGTNFVSGETRQVNLPLEFTFNQDISLESANLTSVRIESVPTVTTGAPTPNVVQGEFYLRGERTLVFQPRCPNRETDLWGFTPGNEIEAVLYRVTLAGIGEGEDLLLQSRTGTVLEESITLDFSTPAPPQQPVKDPLPGRAPGIANENSLAGELGLNLFARPNPPLSIVLDQPVLAASVASDAVKIYFEHEALGLIPLPTQSTLTENCTLDGGARITVTVDGVLPPGTNLHFFLSKEVAGLGGDRDRNEVDLPFHEAVVAPAARPLQRDTLIESFHDRENMDPNPALLVPLANWGDGHLQSAPLFSGSRSDVVIEIGPGSTNGEAVSFDTSGSVLKDRNGAPIFFPDGIIEVGSLSLLAPGDKKSKLEVFGPNPLIIRASQSVTIAQGALLDLNGANAPDVDGLNTANSPAPGGLGKAGGGDGGFGSPITTQSSASGGTGFGPYNIPSGGALGGHSAYGTTGHKNIRPGGGGGGTWGIREVDADGTYVEFCWGEDPYITHCPSNRTSGCTSGTTHNSNGESGGNGAKKFNGNDSFCTKNGDEVWHLDAVTKQCWAQGGEPGPMEFTDSDPSNNFLGRKPILQDGILEIIPGELSFPQGGQGGGGGGDAIRSGDFPSDPAKFPKLDLKGAGGGGGGGAIIIECLGVITIDGRIQAEGGQGAAGEKFLDNDKIAGGGGGGAGGMIILESPTAIVIGNKGQLRTRGGNRGIGGGTLPGRTGGGENCRKNQTAAKGGAGGKGVIQFRLGFAEGSSVFCGGITQPSLEAGALTVSNVPILCERDLTVAGSKGDKVLNRFDPAPQILIPTFGGRSGAQSRWMFLGWSSLAGEPQLDFLGSDPESGTLDPGFVSILASGQGGEVNRTDHSIELDAPILADLIRSEPRTLVQNTFRPSSGAGGRTILSAMVDGSKIHLEFDPGEEGLGDLGNWQIEERFFLTERNGLPTDHLPESATIKVLFQSAEPVEPGSLEPRLDSISLPTADLSSLRREEPLLLRFRILLDANALGDPLDPFFPRPGLGLLRLNSSF